jgi:hypothetical protein
LDLCEGVGGGEDVDGNDIGTGFSKGEGHALTEAASGTGDDGDFAVQFELG